MFSHIRIAKNTLFQVIARIISSATNFLIAVFIAKHFGIFNYGEYTKVTAFVELFYLITDFGFNAIFLQKEDNRLRFKDLFYPRIVLSFLLVLFVNVLALLLPYNVTLRTGFSPLVRFGITLFSFTIITESMLYTSLAIFQRELTYNFFVISSLVGAVVTLLSIAFFVLFSAPFIFIFIAFVIGGIGESITAILLTQEKILPVKFDALFFWELTRETLPVGLMLIFNLVYFRIDILLLSIMKNTQDVAIYDLSYKFFDFLIALPLFLSNALYPTLLDDQKNTRIFYLQAKKRILFFFLLAIPIVIAMWILSPLLGFINHDFSPAAVPLRILVGFLPVFFATSILQWMLIAQKKQLFLTYVYLFSVIGNIVLNLILIPQFSYIGSAVITGVSEIAVFMILFLKLFRTGN